MYADESVAIIGLDFAFPGNAISEDGLWEMLVHGRSSTPSVPKDRFNGESIFDPSRPFPGGHFLNGDIAQFDAPFFGISPAEAVAIDPQQRCLLESSYRALENAGISLKAVRESQTSVHVGCFTNDYSIIQYKDPEAIPTYHSTGNSSAIISNRISWFFDLKGPSLTIDTACSSSLVALHYACEDLQRYHSNMGIVAGVNIICGPELTMGIEKMAFLSPDGLCHSFDERGSGYARGEGYGVLIIKRLSDALESGDTIRGVIRATGVNQDGRTVGLTQPSAAAQEQLLRSTYNRAGISLEHTQFVEAHGTGTSLGDSIEAEALIRSFRETQDEQRTVYIGATKANIGHLEAASGIASIVKTILVLEKGIIPPIAQLESLSSRIQTSPDVTFPKRCVPWPKGGLRRASIQSFGFGGTNAHVILDDSYNFLLERRLIGNHITTSSPPSIEALERMLDATMPQQLHLKNLIPSGANPPLSKLLVFSAAEKGSLARIILAYAEMLRQKNANESKDHLSSFMQDMANTLSERRSSLRWKGYAVVNSVQDLSQLSELARSPEPMDTNRNLGFIFTGQGAQWMGMGKGLLSYEAFRTSIARSEKHLTDLGCKWSLVELFRGSSNADINNAEYSQPICTALQIALVDLLSSFEIAPSVVVGHSSGEIAAAYCVGALSQYAAITVAYYRGLLSGRLAHEEPLDFGMMAVGASEQDMIPYLQQLNTIFSTTKLTMSCINGPRSVTVSGEKVQLNILGELLESDKIPAKHLRVQVAYHSPQMNKIASEYEKLIHSIKHVHQTHKAITMVSSVTGMKVSLDMLSQPAYWVKNLTSPVLFSEALTKACTEAIEVDALLEVGPHSTLQGSVQDTVKVIDSKLSTTYFPLLKRSKTAVSCVLETLGQLYCKGYNLNLLKVNSPQQGCQNNFMTLPNLPRYQFDHSHAFWSESRASKGFRFREHAPHPLLGTATSDWNPYEPRWRLLIRLSNLPFLEDHKVNGVIVYPAAAMIASVIEGGHQISGQREITGYEIFDTTFKTALVFSMDPDNVEIELRFRKLVEDDAANSGGTAYEFRLYSFCTDSWTQLCTGTMRIRYGEVNPIWSDSRKESQEQFERAIHEHEDIAANSSKNLSTRALYEGLLVDFGYRYGPTFQLLSDLTCDSKNQVTARLGVLSEPTENRASLHQTHVVHPAVLDAAFHSSIVAASNGGMSTIPTIVPHHLRKLWISSEGLVLPTKDECVYVSSRAFMTTSRKMEASITVFSKTSNKVLVEIETFEGAAVSEVKSQKTESVTSNLCFRMEWRPDIDLMNSQQILSYCWESIELGRSEQNMARFERDVTVLIFRSIFGALKRIEEGSLVPSKQYMEKYVRWMRLQAERFHEGRFPDIQTRYGEVSGDGAQLADLRRQAEADKRWRYYIAVCDNLPSVLSGEVDPLQVLFGQEHAVDFYEDMVTCSRNGHAIQKYLTLLAHKKPGLRVLEIGAGTGSTTRSALKGLAVDEGEPYGRHDQFLYYEYTDVSPSLVASAQEIFGPHHPNMRFKTLDIEKDPEKQGFASGSYDLIIAAGVLHATADLNTTLQNVRSLLEPGGKLVLVEVVRPERLPIGFAFGLLPGWWLSNEDYRQNSPCISENLWNRVLRDSGFSGVDSEFPDFISEECHAESTLISTALPGATCLGTPSGDDWPIVIAHATDPRDLELAYQVQYILQQKLGLGCTITPWECLPSNKALTGKRYIILNVYQNLFMQQDLEKTFFRTQSLVSSASQTLWVTDGGGEKPVTPQYGLMHGLARTVRRENNALHFVTLALDLGSSNNHSADNTVQVFDRLSLSRDTGDYEPEYLQMNHLLHVNRILPSRKLNYEVQRGISGKVIGLQGFGEAPVLKLCTGVDGIYFQEDTDANQSLEPDEIEIEVQAAGCTPTEELALGHLDVGFIGLEVSGIVTRIGSQCAKLKEGDVVVAYAPHTFRSFVRTKECLASPLPPQISRVQGVTLPISFGTAYRALVDVACLEPNETILIHSAAGDVAYAAVQIARYIGAKIFATANSEKERDFLIERYKISPRHIFDGNVRSFPSALKRENAGCGVDVVLRTSSRGSLQASWQCVASHGRFVELGKKDGGHAKLGMSYFANNIAFATVNLVPMMQDRPRVLGRLLGRIVEMVQKGDIEPLDTTVFGISKIQDVFKHLISRGPHEKIVVEIERGEVVQAVRRLQASFSFRSDATYIIAGLGGLGRSIARWMAGRGAKHLLLLSRSGAFSDASRELVNDLERKGLHVEAPPCDIANAEELSSLLQGYTKVFPKVRGCIQAAMVLKDAVFEKMSAIDFRTAIDPKIHGSWNLHSLLPSSLDFFIMLSSVAGVFGSGGQANYAAGNTYQDALARYRHAMGHKATSIDLGSITEEGYLSDNPGKLDGLFRSDGVIPMSQDILIRLLEHYCNPNLESSPLQLITGLTSPSQIRSQGIQEPWWISQPLFGTLHLLSNNENSQSSTSNTEAKKAIDFLQVFQSEISNEDLTQLVMESLVLRIERILPESFKDNTTGDEKIRQPIHNLGLDSLVAIELKNWLKKELAVDVSTSEILGDIGIETLSSIIVRRSRLNRLG